METGSEWPCAALFFLFVFLNGSGWGWVDWLVREQGSLLMVAVRRSHELVASLTWFQGLLLQPATCMDVNTGLIEEKWDIILYFIIYYILPTGIINKI